MAKSIFTQKEENRKRDIIKTCLRIIDERGIKGLTVVRIAHEIGFSESALYRHFKSKKEIISLIIEETRVEAREQYSALSQDSGNSIQNLELLLRLHLEFLQQFPGLFRIIYWDEIQIGESALMQKLENLTNELLKVIEEIFNKGKKEKLIKAETDAKTAAIHFLGTVQIAFSFWNIKHRKGSLPSMGGKLLSQLLAGIQA